ncbi:hypothetical protein NQ317_007799 [Molorchus minor]|uniref:Uncharacterized protein n=1 Tax=Molorchus minor TaxID=1323400 RepID=A0ABQ9IYW7_9CUCU|nr:hypothetical protein NQ317_007799 [Molorchus minor]
MNGEGGDESWLTSWEQQCVDSMEEQPNYEQSLIGETNISQTKTWTSFQDSATAVAQLYRDDALLMRVPQNLNLNDDWLWRQNSNSKGGCRII